MEDGRWKGTDEASPRITRLSSAPVSYFVIPTSYFPVAVEGLGEPERTKEHNRDNGVSGKVVPSLHGRDVLSGGDPDEKKRAPEICDDCDRDSANYQDDSTGHGQAL